MHQKMECYGEAEFSYITILFIVFLGTAGEHTESVGGVWDVSNKRRLGYSELDALTEMANGVKTLIMLEESLEAKEEAEKGAKK